MFGWRLRACLLFLLPVTAQGATFTLLGGNLPDDVRPKPSAVSADGQVVVGNGLFGGVFQGWRWTEATGIQHLGELAGGVSGTSAVAVSADGNTVVGRSDSASGQQAFRWTASEGMQGLGTLSAEALGSAGQGVTADGSVVIGISYLPASPRPVAVPFRWSQDDGMSPIEDMPVGIPVVVGGAGANEDIIVVGAANTVEGPQAFRWASADGLTYLGDLPGGDFDSFATGASTDGRTVVGQSRSGAGHEAFVWTPSGGMRGLGDLPGGLFDSIANDVSADGSLIVGHGDSAGGNRAVLWTAAGGLELLLDVLAARGAKGLEGWNLVDATSVSPDGNWIVGWAEDADGNFSAYRANLSPVPLSGTGWLLATACIAASGRIRRRATLRYATRPRTP